MNLPFFSIIIPTFNRLESLFTIIQNIQNQSFENWELVIVDHSQLSSVQQIDELGDDGGSKNLKNKIDSTRIMLEKHISFFKANPRVERLLTQVMGVSFLRLGNFKEAKYYLRKAYLIDPLKFDTLGRFLIACFPLLAKKIYKVDSIK